VRKDTVCKRRSLTHRRGPAPSSGRLLLATLALLATPLPAQGSAPARPDYTAADVSFMQDMILHHAQAVVMSDWVPTHGASERVLTLAKRIGLSQRDEIRLMQDWLLDRHLAAPDPLHRLSKQAGPVHDTSPLNMPGMDMERHPMIMSGMLTPEQMRQLDAAHGTEFDRLYLQGMIPHHEGALTMVAQLYASPAGGQQSDVSGFANDIDAGQRAEIARMQALLNTLTASKS
jgi:uncharacterized protein (DUF305 family)